MLSSVLKSEKAIQVNVTIMRAFVKMREAAFQNKELMEIMRRLEAKTSGHDEDIKLLFGAIREMARPEYNKKRRIGFITELKKTI